MKKLYILCILYFTAGTAVVLSQSLESLFDAAVQQSERKYMEMSRMRGIYRPSTHTHFSTTHLLSYLEQWKGIKKVGILLYTSANDSISIAFVNTDREIIFSRFKLAVTQLTAQELRLRNALGIEQQALASDGKNRGVAVKSKTKQLPYEKVLKETASLVLPPDLPVADVEHLIIIPALNIGALPWAALPLDKRTMLIDKMSYAIVPSIQDLFSLTAEYKAMEGHDTFNPGEMGKHKMEFTDALFVAGPHLTSDSLKAIFPDLPGAEKEVALIAATIPGSTILTGEQATKRHILRAMAYKQLIYFATHGIADTEDPLHKSFLLVSGGNNQTPYLTAGEIQELAVQYDGGLRASLVVLSACQTGLGKSHEGGMIGLARAFHIAGASNIVMSLWNVEDASTAQLMTTFFEYLEKEEQYIQPHGALRAAMLELRKKHPHPRNWAAFSVLGVGTF